MEAALNSSLGRTVLGPSVLRIGRATDNTLAIQDQESSSHHAEITPSFGGNSYQIIDLGSTNGTFVNEQRLTPHSPRVLAAGDVIRIGSTSLTFEMSGSAASYAPTVSANDPIIAASAPTVAGSVPNFGASAPNYGSSAPTVAGSAPNFGSSDPTVAASAPNFGGSAPNYGASAPTVAGSAPNFGASAPTPNYEPTISASDPFAQTVAQTTPPAFQQPPAYGNYTVPAQPSYTPPPTYPQPQVAYPQEQPMYPQSPTPYPQPSYPQPEYSQPGFGQPSYPQPGYPQPGFNQPEMYQQKKSRTGLFIAIAVILILIVGGGGTFFYIQSLPSPQKTLQAYCNALKAGDYQTAYNQFSSRVQSQISEAQFAGLLKLGLALEGGVKDCTVTNVTQDSSTTAHGTLTYTFGNGKVNSGDGPLILENGSWKIDTSNTNNTNNTNI